MEEAYQEQSQTTEDPTSEKTANTNQWLLIIGLLFGLLALGGIITWLFWSSSENKLEENNVSQITQTASTSDAVNTHIENSSTSTPGIYRNEEWGFEFRYPHEWTIIIPAFGSRSSLFNMALQPPEPKYPDTIYINITPKWWIDRLLDNLPQPTDEKMIDGVLTIVIQEPSFGIPTNSLLALFNDEFWLDISGRVGYEEELELIRSTFHFNEIHSLEELGIEPYIPDNIE